MKVDDDAWSSKAQGIPLVIEEETTFASPIVDP
jgi:hypothetical protein